MPNRRGMKAAEGLQNREVKHAGRCKKTEEWQRADVFEMLAKQVDI